MSNEVKRLNDEIEGHRILFAKYDKESRKHKYNFYFNRYYKLKRDNQADIINKKVQTLSNFLNREGKLK